VSAISSMKDAASDTWSNISASITNQNRLLYFQSKLKNVIKPTKISQCGIIRNPRIIIFIYFFDLLCKSYYLGEQ